ncbi:MAG: S-layer homology domain-containing protein [Firmicutes bacterium]|nr:S-layer homology domain-containing protein [Bacillota bacterium]
MLRKFILYCLLVGGLFLSPAVFASGQYSDITEGHWAWPYLQKLAEVGVLEPFDSSEFAGDKPLTRFEYLQSTAALLDYLDLNSSQVAGEVEAKKYTLRLEEEVSDLANRLNTLEARFRLQDIVLESLKADLSDLDTNGTLTLNTTLSTAEIQSYEARISQLEKSVNELQNVINKKDEQIQHLYIIIALLGATSILK